MHYPPFIQAYTFFVIHSFDLVVDQQKKLIFVIFFVTNQFKLRRKERSPPLSLPQHISLIFVSSSCDVDSQNPSQSNYTNTKDFNEEREQHLGMIIDFCITHRGHSLTSAFSVQIFFFFFSSHLHLLQNEKLHQLFKDFFFGEMKRNV